MRLRRSALLPAFGLMLVPAFEARAQAWVPPTPQELQMRAPADDPGANAVYLSYDEVDDDQHNDHNISVRLKILTQAGIEHFADVASGFNGRQFNIENVQGRTIHADGTVIPFTGKPFVKAIREHGETYRATVFSMPDVQVGSILEYHFRLAYDDNVVLPARWYLQQNAYVLHEHFLFKPFYTGGSKYVVIDHGQTTQGLAYASVLPPGAKVLAWNNAGRSNYELTLSNIPALPDEDAIPPIASLGYRVLFYYAAQFDEKSYWNNEAKFISKDMNNFAVLGPRMRADLVTLVAPGDSDEVKARKLYAAVMKLENTTYTRQHTREEDTAQGLHAVRTAEDIWVRGRGNSDELALTYLAFLRGAGVHAYGMKVTDRDRNLFNSAFIDTSQLDDIIVIASLGGRETFLDPGTRFCSFGQLSWPHSFAQGVRQRDSGAELAQAGPLTYKDTVLTRTALLGLTDTGEVGGTLTLVYTGQAAMLHRQEATGEALPNTKERFEEEARRMLPGGMKLHVISIDNLDDSEKPLRVIYGVGGAIGTVTGHRLLVNEALLRNDESELFTGTDRKSPVYFHYPYMANDSVTLTLPPGFKLEAVPAEQKASALDSMAFDLRASITGNTVKLTRAVAMNAVILPATDYPKLREFFANLRTADENQLLLTREASVSDSKGTSAAVN